VNSRNTSIVSDYQNCSYQGVNPGWADNYNGGITGQWVTVTGLDTSKGPVTTTLKMIGNPKSWLCEGVLQKDPNGNVEWAFSGEYTVAPPWPQSNLPIDIYKCVYSPGSLNNNNDTINVNVPADGEGLITSTCLNQGQEFGYERDCEFTKQNMMMNCTPGVTVNLQCTIPSGSNSQVLRICESSIVLGTGTACRFNDAWTLANVVIEPKKHTTVSFVCSTKRDSQEVGGFYSMYSGALFNGVDANAFVSCTKV